MYMSLFFVRVNMCVSFVRLVVFGEGPWAQSLDHRATATAAAHTEFRKSGKTVTYVKPYLMISRTSKYMLRIFAAYLCCVVVCMLTCLYVWFIVLVLQSMYMYLGNCYWGGICPNSYCMGMNMYCISMTWLFHVSTIVSLWFKGMQDW